MASPGHTGADGALEDVKIVITNRTTEVVEIVMAAVCAGQPASLLVIESAGG
jgi:hypothetical protein